MHRRTGRALLLLLMLALPGCAGSDAPDLPAAPSPVVERAAQWRGIAEDAALQIGAGLPPGARLVIAAPDRRSAFADRLPDLLAAAFIRQGFAVWSAPPGDAAPLVQASAPGFDLPPADGSIGLLRVETRITAVGHDAEDTRSLLEAGHYTLLATGVYLLEKAGREGVDLVANPGWLIGAGLAADLANWAERPTPSTELVLGVRVLDGTRYVTATDRVYLIRDGDRGLYTGRRRASPDTITVLYDPRGDSLSDARQAAASHCAQTARRPMLAARWAPAPDLPHDPVDLAVATLVDDGGRQPRHGARFDCVDGDARF